MKQSLIKLTLHRNGIFQCTNRAPNQCKSIGHTKYKYWVALTCKNELDSEGFIIDQIELHSLIVSELQLKSMSCEEYALKISQIIQDECNRRDIDLYHLYTKVAPVANKQVLRAFIECNVYLQEVSPLFYPNSDIEAEYIKNLSNS